jgi:hypothetical protein
LFIVGTANNSNILANRTRRLINEIKPDTVFVQASPQWGNAVKFLDYVKSQEEMDKANTHLAHLDGVPKQLTRSARFQLVNYIFKCLGGLPMDYNPFLAGLEVKYAVEEATKLNSKIVYCGSEFSEGLVGKLAHEKRSNILEYLLRDMFRLNSSYQNEIKELQSMISNKGLRSYVESSLDAKQINWFIAVIEILIPEIKRIFVDYKDEELFKQIVENKGKRMVAVVNQHHMEGLEHHWCNAYGQIPTFNNDLALDKINPIGDMPLRKMLYDKMYHNIKRSIGSSRLKAPPASFTNDVNVYHREWNHQYEHRNM